MSTEDTSAARPSHASPQIDAWQAAIDYGIDMNQVEYLLTLTPDERLVRHDQALQLVRALREAGIKYYGFDPRHPEAPAGK